ncbi:MAG: hypothetical protein AB1861_21835 [Cyanobacteriota bacterium]
MKTRFSLFLIALVAAILACNAPFFIAETPQSAPTTIPIMDELSKLLTPDEFAATSQTLGCRR